MLGAPSGGGRWPSLRRSRQGRNRQGGVTSSAIKTGGVRVRWGSLELRLSAHSPNLLSARLLAEVLSNRVTGMQIFVRAAGTTLPLEVSPASSVESVKAAVEDVTFIPSALQRLVIGGTQLTMGTLEGLGIAADSSIDMLLDVNGGMRAKWRKKRMRRLRRKRRKMRQRAR